MRDRRWAWLAPEERTAVHVPVAIGRIGVGDGVDRVVIQED